MCIKSQDTVPFQAEEHVDNMVNSNYQEQNMVFELLISNAAIV